MEQKLIINEAARPKITEEEQTRPNPKKREAATAGLTQTAATSRRIKKAKTKESESNAVAATQNNFNLEKIQKSLGPFFTIYCKGNFSTQQLIHEISKFKTQIPGNQFLLLCVPTAVTLIAKIWKADPQQDEFFQWILNELEQYLIQQGALTKNPDIKKLLIQLCYNEASFIEALKYPHIKNIIQKHYAVTLIKELLFQEKLPVSPLKFLKQHFTEEVIETLKTTPMFAPPSAYGSDAILVCFLDRLPHDYMQYVPELWNNGFKPSDQQKFNFHFFSSDFKMVPDQQIISTFRTLLLGNGYDDFLAFPASENPISVMLSNPCIDERLFKVFLKRTQSTLDLNSLMGFNHYELPSKLMYVINTIDKFIYGLSALPEAEINEPEHGPENIPDISSKPMPLATPFNTILSRKIRTALSQFCGEDYIAIPQSITHLLGLLHPTTSIADKLVFYYAQSIELGKQIRCTQQITRLIEFLKAKHANPMGLLRALLNAYFINLQQNDQDHFKPVIQKLFGNFIEQRSSDELQPLLSNYIEFTSSLLIQWNRKPQEEQKSNSPSPLKDYTIKKACIAYVNRLATLLSIMPEHIKPTPIMYYQLGTILVIGYSSFVREQKTDIPAIKKFILEFLLPFSALTYQQELIGNLLAQFVAIRYSVGIASSLNLIDAFSSIEPTWINYVLNNLKLDGKEFNTLSLAMSRFSGTHKPFAETTVRVINKILTLLKGNKTHALPEDFLKAVAEWQLDLKKRAQLSETTQKQLETIYNQCIHHAQGTAQETTFEEMRTQLLLKFDVNPMEDAQAVHSRENHVFADRIFAAWIKELGTEVAGKLKMSQGWQALYDYLQVRKRNDLNKLLEFTQDKKNADGYISWINGCYQGDSAAKFETIQNPIKSNNMVYQYLSKLRTRAEPPITNAISREEVRAIDDARKLVQLISMIAYYSLHGIAPSPFAIHDGPEAMNILFNELIDQVEHDSCDQGPFIRLLIALEPAAEFKFPYLTRITIQFYIKEYVNNYYQQLALDGKNQFIQYLYAQVDNKDAVAVIDYIPENTLSFLKPLFCQFHSERLGFITHKEIDDLFNMERPEKYHPQIIEALNQHHQAQRNAMVLSSNAQNPHGFFMNQEAQTTGNNSMVLDDGFLMDADPDWVDWWTTLK